jgi:hypothetical protein
VAACHSCIQESIRKNLPRLIGCLPAYFLQPSGRLSVPYVMIYYLPVTCNNDVRMLYASAKELMRNTAEVGKILEIDSPEDLDDIEEKLKGES